MDEAARAARDGCAVVACGEMGIGNTTPAACLTALLAGVSADKAVGRGAGADDRMVAVKRTVVADAVAREAARLTHPPQAAIAALAGYEIAAMAGFFAAAADRKSVVSGKGVSVRVDLVGRRIYKKKKDKD